MSQLSASTLKNLITLVEKRDSLREELAKIEPQIAAVLAGTASSKATGKPARGSIMKAIVDALQKAGPKGVRVMDLSAQLGNKPANVHVWFATTGKTIKGIRKIGPGRYALS